MVFHHAMFDLRFMCHQWDQQPLMATTGPAEYGHD